MSLNIVTVPINGSAKEQLPTDTVGVVGVRILTYAPKNVNYAMLNCLYHITIQARTQGGGVRGGSREFGRTPLSAG